MQCEHCGRETPDGHYCGYCGAQLRTGGASRNPARRGHAYAIDPHQSVNQPDVISTFFPHLNPQRTRLFRWLLVGLVIAVVLLGFARLLPISTVLSALLIPVLYLAYFYVVQFYQNEPVWVIGGTFLMGAALGVVSWLLIYGISARLYRPGLSQQSTPSLLFSGVVAPLIGQALMLVGPLILFFARRSQFNDMLDGLTFGIASGLGFAAAESVIQSWSLYTTIGQIEGDALSLALRNIPIALLKPLLYAATTGLICAALWLKYDRTPPEREMGPLTSLPVAIAAAVLGLLIPNVGVGAYGGLLLNILWYGVALLGLMLLLRRVLHVGLLDKARSIGHGGTIRCPHCHQTVEDLPFCPNCGIAMRSVTKRARGAQLSTEAASE